jgi:hypothetical protein
MTLSLAPLAFFFVLAFGALHLPARGQLFAAAAAVLLFLGVWVWVGIFTYRGHAEMS